MARVPVPRSPLALADAADTFADALDDAAGHTASGLTAAQFTDLRARATAVRNAEAASADAERAYRAAVRTADTAHDGLDETYRALRGQADRHTNMTDELRERAGIGTSDGSPSPGTLPTITDLTAVRRPSGAVFLDWSGPTGGTLRYEVFAREGDGAWALIGSATATDFTHRGGAPAAHRDYHVVPCRGERRGEPSNVAGLDA